MGKCIFVTGTDTDVGKTVIVACLEASLKKAGKKVAVYKPIQCGDLLKGNIKSPDLALVKELTNISDQDLMNDFSFQLAASPHLAAEQEKAIVDVQTIKDHTQSLQNSYDVVIIEGAGGLIVPLTRSYTILDLIKDLSVPVLIISRAGLGTINHTSLTVKALKSHNIPIIGIILNYFKGGIIEEDNKKIISTLNNIPILGIVPFSNNIKDIVKDFEKYVDIKKVLQN